MTQPNRESRASEKDQEKKKETKKKTKRTEFQRLSSPSSSEIRSGMMGRIAGGRVAAVCRMGAVARQKEVDGRRSVLMVVDYLIAR